MKRIIYLLFILIGTAAFTSCTKVIDVNIDNAPARVVINGYINDNTSAVVKLSKSVELDQNNTFPGLSGATVTIADDKGNTETLAEKTPGVYSGSIITGEPGHTYTLTVVAEGTTYTATSTMPKPVVIDSLSTRNIRFGEQQQFVEVNYQDPVGLGDNYRAVLRINDSLIPDIFVEDDKYTDGNPRQALLFSPNYELKTGDIVDVEVSSIDKNVYEYLLQLIEAGGNSNLASPANPATNIKGGALGYFSAQTSSVITMVIE